MFWFPPLLYFPVTRIADLIQVDTINSVMIKGIRYIVDYKAIKEYSSVTNQFENLV